MSAATCPTVWTGWRAWPWWEGEGKNQTGLRPGGGDASQMVSDHHQLQLRSDLPEIVSVAGYHGLPGPLRTNGDVGIDDVGRPGSCQQSAYSRRVRSAP